LDEHKIFYSLAHRKEEKTLRGYQPQVTHGGVGLLRELVCEQNRLAEICKRFYFNDSAF